MQTLRRLLLLAALALPATLCQAVPTLDDELRDLRLAEGEGLVVMQSHTPKSRIASQPPNWMGLWVQRDGDKPRVITNLANQRDDHSLFMGKLPAGEYRVNALAVVLQEQTSSTIGTRAANNLMFRNEFSSQTFSLPLADDNRRFVVQAGTLSDLGAAVTLPTEAATVMFKDRSQQLTRHPVQVMWLQSPPESDRLASLLRERLPQLQVLKPAEAWLKGPLVTSEQLAATLPTLRGLSAVAQWSREGVIYTAQGLGHIRRVTKDGESSWIGTGLTGAVTAVGVGSDGSLAAGTSLGLLAIRPAGDTAWRTLPLPQVQSTPIAISLGTGGIHLLARRGRDVQLLYKATPDASEPWTPLRAFSISAVGHSHFELQVTPEGISVLEEAMGWFASTTLHFWDAKSKAWSEAEVPTFGMVTGLSTLTPEAQVVNAKGHRSNPQLMQVSTDHGKSWSEAPGPDFFRTIHMQSRTQGFASRLDSDPRKASVSPVYSLWRTEDGGLNWLRVGPIPEPFNRVFRMSNEVLIGVSGGGVLYRSADGGEAWAGI